MPERQKGITPWSNNLFWMKSVALVGALTLWLLDLERLFSECFCGGPKAFHQSAGYWLACRSTQRKSVQFVHISLDCHMRYLILFPVVYSVLYRWWQWLRSTAYVRREPLTVRSHCMREDVNFLLFLQTSSLCSVLRVAYCQSQKSRYWRSGCVSMSAVVCVNVCGVIPSRHGSVERLHHSCT